MDIYIYGAISIINGIGTGTISLKDEASDYNIAYQKIDIEESKFIEIKNKLNEVNTYIEEANKTLDEKYANANNLQKEYKKLVESGTATEEEKAAAYDKYNKAYNEYKEYHNNTSKEIERLKKEYEDLIPKYTDSWINTTKTKENVRVDFTNYSGTINFIIWAKIENGTNTYYDKQIYTTEIRNTENVTINKKSANIKVNETLQLTAESSINATITWTSSDNTIATVDNKGLVKGIKEGTTIITAKGKEKIATCTITVKAENNTENIDKDGDWTNFTNAKIKLKKEGSNNAIIEISNIIANDNSNYYVFINSNNKKPDLLNEVKNEKILMKYDKGKNILKTDSPNVAKYIEINQDLYVTIIEEKKHNQNEKIVAYGEKLTRYQEPKYNDAFNSPYMSNTSDKITTNFTHHYENNRKLQIKVGKITDSAILQKIKNKDNAGFNSLLSFAKSNDGIYNKITNIGDNHLGIDYIANDIKKENEIIKLNGLKNGEYYFLYVKALDENGKYIEQEAVTFAKADVNNQNWKLLFYGDKDFKWSDFENEEEKNVTIIEKLPHAGIKTIICTYVIITLIGFGIYSYMQYRKNNF